MLIRADPATKTISMLSFPRDLASTIYCPGAHAGLRPHQLGVRALRHEGTLETVRKLTGLPINYLITVNFRGFREIVDKLGGVWLDIDRRYYNQNDGRASTNFSNIDLQPGYQRLDGAQRARVRPLPPHRRRLPPERAPAGVRAGVQGAGRGAPQRLPQAAR